MSDAQLRTYRFVHSAPETIEGFSKTKPEGAVVPSSILFKYDIPHTKGSRAGMVWCCYCQERNHFNGSLVEYSDSVRRSVGRCCRSKHCRQLEALLEEFDDHHIRRLQLDQFDKIARVVPDVLVEVRQRLAAGDAMAFQQHRRIFADDCHGLFSYLYAAVIDHNGELTWEMETADYSRTVLSRESSDEGDDVDGKGKEHLRGKRIVRLHRKYRIEGGELFNLGFSPLTALTAANATLQQAAEFYGQGATDKIEGDDFNHWMRSLRDVVDVLERVQRALFAVPAFYAADNRRKIVAIRNNRLQESAYSLTETGIVWNPPDGDRVVIEPPRDYNPVRFRTIARLRRVIR